MYKICYSTLLNLLLLSVATVTAAAEDHTVFKGGDVTVSYTDIERYIVENTPADPNERAAALSQPEIYGKMAESLYTLRVVAAEAEKMPDFDRAQAEWAARTMSQRRIVKDYRKKYIEDMSRHVNWSAMAEEAYRAEKGSYMTDELVNASHILINVTADRTEAEAKALALDLRARALNGEEFAKLATEYSDDPAAVRNGGNLGFFQRGQMVPPFEEVAFAMQTPEAISEPVRSTFGYHVIQYHSRKAPEQRPFASVKETIVEELKTQMGNKVWQDKLIAIRSASDIVVDKKLLRELQEKYQTKATNK